MTTTATVSLGDRISLVRIAHEPQLPDTAHATVTAKAGDTVTALLDDGRTLSLSYEHGDVWVGRDPALDIEQALDDDERRRAVEWFTSRNPHWDGAHLSDILGALADVDAYLELVEPLFDGGRFSDLLGEGCSRAWALLASYAAYAAVLLGADDVDGVGQKASELLLRVGCEEPARRFVPGI